MDHPCICDGHGHSRQRNLFTHHDKELRPFTKAAIPQWSAAADDAGFEEEDTAAEEQFEDE